MLQEDLVRNTSAVLTGLTPAISKGRPVIYSWIPVDLNPILINNTQLSFNSKTEEEFNPFNITIPTNLVGDYNIPATHPKTNVVFPGGRPLNNITQNKIFKYYSDLNDLDSTLFNEELEYLKPTNHYYKDVVKDMEKMRIWEKGHKGRPGGYGAIINRVEKVFGADWPIEATELSEDPVILNPNADSLIPYIFGVPNNPTITVSIDTSVIIDSYDGPIASKIFYSSTGPLNRSTTTTSPTSHEFFYNSTTSYRKANGKELDKKAYAPMDVIYLKYDDPILPFLMQPTSKVNFTRIQYTRKTVGDNRVITYIPKILVFQPTDNPAYYLLNGGGSKLVGTNIRQLSLCRELNPKGWFTHAFIPTNIIS